MDGHAGISEKNEPMLTVEGIKKYYPIHKGLLKKTCNYVRAVDGVSLTINPGEIFGLVGESGCGKSTLGMMIAGLEHQTAGKIYFEGTEINPSAWKTVKNLRTDIQMIFQDPYSSLNPRYTVGDILREPLRVCRKEAKSEINSKIKQLMDSVNLPGSYLNKYPNELSGGERQRVGIARALTVGPKLIICDEPVSALDVSMQAQILNLIKNLQQEYKLTFMFIAHGLGSVLYVSDRVAVMYLGNIMEIGTADDIFSNPVHPYTSMLLNAYPVPDPTQREKKKRASLGEIPSPCETNVGCKFRSRCSFATKQCGDSRPELTSVEDSPSHLCACFCVPSTKGDQKRNA